MFWAWLGIAISYGIVWVAIMAGHQPSMFGVSLTAYGAMIIACLINAGLARPDR